MKQKASSHLFAVLMLGIVSQICQVLFLRELLMVFHGNELSIGLILAAWLVWVGVGSYLGAYLIEKVSRPLFFLMLNTLTLFLMLPATILFVRGLRGFFDVLPGAYLSLFDMIFSCFLIMAPACLLLGAQFVLLSRLWRERNQVEDTSGAEKTYIGEATGNMLGGGIFVLFMVHYLGSLQSVFVAGILMLIAVLMMKRKAMIGSERTFIKFPLLWVGLLVFTFFAFPILESVDDWAYQVQWRNFAPQHELIETRQSRYGAISVSRREDQFNFFQSGHLIFSTAGPETKIPGLEEQDAVEFAHLAMAQHENPERVLLIGGGLRGTLIEILKHAVERVDYVELDKVLTEVARPYISPRTVEALDDPNVRLIHEDGRLFVKTAQEKYDMIIVDKPDPFTAELNRYYTEDFFREAKALLDQDGVFVTGVTSTPDLRATSIANRNATIYHTLDSVFSRVLPAGERFMFYFASDAPGQISIDAEFLQERYRERDLEVKGFLPEHYHTLLEETQLQRINWVVRNHGRVHDAHLDGPGAAPPFPGTLAEQEQAEDELEPVKREYFINSDFKPIGYYYTLMFWEDLTRDYYPFSLKYLLQVKPWWVLPLACLPLLFVLGLRVAAKSLRKRAVSRFGVLFAVFTTGLSTMTLQIALLFSFQSIYGFVYEIVGLITAMFMCGLAVGAFFTHRFVAKKAEMLNLASVQLCMALMAVIIAFVLPQAAAVRSPFMIFIFFSALTFVAGLINGVDFPLTVSCYMSFNRRAEKSAGTVYGIELFGASFGAILASAMIAPILGIAACFLLAAIASALSCMILLIGRRCEYLHD